MDLMTLALSRSTGAIVIVPTVFFFVYLLTRVAVAEKERKARLELIRETLQSGKVDDALKRELLAALAGPTAARQRQPWRGSWWAGLGWIAFCVGIALLFLDDTFEAGAIVAASGFALLSLPIALREAQGERHA